MKIDKDAPNVIDLDESLREMYAKDHDFWKGVERYILHGVPATDERGHWVEIRVRVRPSQLDLITAVREKHPVGMYKSQADLVRSLIATGTKTHFEYFKRQKGMQWEILMEILDGLNVLGREHRLRELRKDVQSAMNLTVNGSYNADEKAKVIDLLSQMEKKIANL